MQMRGGQGEQPTNRPHENCILSPYFLSFLKFAFLAMFSSIYMSRFLKAPHSPTLPHLETTCGFSWHRQKYDEWGFPGILWDAVNLWRPLDVSRRLEDAPGFSVGCSVTQKCPWFNEPNRGSVESRQEGSYPQGGFNPRLFSSQKEKNI